MKTFLLKALTIASIASIASLYATAAQAQATRTWVSGVGDDANPCSRTAPCKTFAGAYSKTAVGGEINVLDPGGFGAVTISHSLSIISGFGAGVLVSSGNGIVVNAGSNDTVLLEGLDIEGLRTAANGVNIIGSGRTTIRKCSIRDFTGNGVNLVGIANARAVIENSLIVNNGGGLNIQGNAGALNGAFLKDSFVDNNTGFATQTAGPGSLVLIGSTLSGSPFSIITTGGADVASYGNNVLRNGGAPTRILTLQ